MTIETVISVRGEARRVVAPDYALLDLAITAPPAPRADALKTVRSSQEQLTDSLGELGGVALTVDTPAAGLTWSFGSIDVHDQYRYDESTGEHAPSGNVTARASVTIATRQLQELTPLSQRLAAIEHLDLGGVRWRVDADNAAWSLVRADAIRAALAKADDYAAALGGTVMAVDHVADAGLLDGSSPSQRDTGLVFAQAASGESGDGGGVPTFEPVPQELHAVIEARVTAHTDPPPQNRG